MPQILIAHPAASSRWKTDTIVDVYPDTDNMHSFPEPLYTIIKMPGKIDEIKEKLQECAGTTTGKNTGKIYPNSYIKNLSASALTKADQTVLENKDTDPISVSTTFSKLTALKCDPIDDALDIPDIKEK